MRPAACWAGGRPIELVIKDNHGVPARGIRNIAEFVPMPNLVAVFGGRFSPVVLEQLSIIKEAKLPFMVVWSATDPIIDNGMQPNYVFRLSLRDSLAIISTSLNHPNTDANPDSRAN